jgi:hypothetical protein
MVRRAGIATAVVLVLSIGHGAILAAPAPTGGLRIESFTHDARRPLKAGDSFTVTIRGSAGASATFDIFGVADDVRMREARPGVYGAQPAVYAGTYTVRLGDAARRAAVFASLKIGGQEIIGSSDRSITIDTRPPEITSVQPTREARLTNIRPNIVVSFFDGDSSVNPGAVRLLVNGRNVTAEASITETSVSFVLRWMSASRVSVPAFLAVFDTSLHRIGMIDETFRRSQLHRLRGQPAEVRFLHREKIQPFQKILDSKGGCKSSASIRRQNVAGARHVISDGHG